MKKANYCFTMGVVTLSAAFFLAVTSFAKGSSGIFHQVKKGETLQTISQLYFNTTRRWMDIYELNRNASRLTAPDRLEPGMSIRIPENKKAENKKIAALPVAAPKAAESSKETAKAKKPEVYPSVVKENIVELDLEDESSVDRSPASDAKAVIQQPRGTSAADKVLRSKSVLPFYNEMIDR